MVEFTAGEFSTLMSTNFESVFHLCQLAYPLLRESEAGSVVSISSVSGFVSLKNMSVQSATKGWYLLLCSIHSFRFYQDVLDTIRSKQAINFGSFRWSLCFRSN